MRIGAGQFGILCVFAALLVLFVCYPHMVSMGASSGLILWFQIVIPALLPFLLFSVVFFRLGVTEMVSSLVYPIFSRVYGVTQSGCYPVLIGLLSGYPLGAKMTADSYQRGDIDRRQAQYLLGFVNNASPMFLLEYVGIQCIGGRAPGLFWVCVTLSAFLGARFDLWLSKRHGGGVWESGHGGMIAGNGHDGERGIVQVIDESILDCCETLVKIGGYIILFSVLLTLLLELFPFGEGIGCCLAALLEITNGADRMGRWSADPLLRDSLLCGFCAFGGLSSVAQTASVISHTDLSILSYLVKKVRQSVFAFSLYYIMAMMYNTLA